MNRKFFSKATALLLSLTFVLTAFVSLPVNVSAAGEYIDISLVDYPRGGGTNTWGHDPMHFMNGWNMSSSSHFTAKAAENKNMQVAYCVQPNVPLSTGDQSPEILPDTFLDTYNNGALTSDQIQKLIGRIFQYGYTGRVTTTLSDNEISEMIATQLLVWEVVVGERNPDFGHINPPSSLNAVTDSIRAEHPLRSLIFGHYNRIVTSVVNHSKVPSFLKQDSLSATVHELTWNGTNYSVTLTDSNNIMSDFTFTSNNANVTCQKSGNQLIITSTNPPSGEVQIHGTRTGSVRSAVAFWCNNKIVVKGEVQGLVMCGQDISDPLDGFVKVKVSTGTLAIVKSTTNNNGKVEGFDFRVTKDGALVGTFTSGADGRISIPNLVAGWYKVEEVNLSDDFVKPTPNPVDVEVKGGQTATVNFSNVKKMGIITVVKTNALPVMGDYSLAGAEFTVKDSSGNTVDTIITGADGRGQSKPLPLGTYTIFESKAPWGFVRDKNTYTRTLSGSQGTGAVVYCPEAGIAEKPQVGQITITKLDAETAAVAQGDATLSGAVFDLLDSKGNLVERLYCGNNVSVTSKQIPLGDYVVREYIPPRGYTLSQKDYPVKIDYAGQDVEVNLKSTDVQNRVIKGKIQLVKHSDDPDPQVDPENTQVQEPLEGIVFLVYLKSAGSYEKAKPSERDRIVTDEHGYAVTKDLPFGTYVVEETDGGAPEHKICAPFDATISEDGRTYYYIVEDPTYFGKVKIIKTDVETGKIIPQPNVEFKVKNLDTGKWVEQEILYPTPITISSYLTNSEGWLVMPQELHYGRYELWEQQSPYGYILSKDPIPFTITSENPVEYLEVKMPNKPAMGKVTVEKTGEMLVGANKVVGKSDTFYTPVYEVRGLPGAKFNIIARNDIVTPDGTVRLKAGAIADTITTGSDGKAESKALYLGDYYAVETHAPFGSVLDPAEHDFSLIYKDQNTPVVTTQISVFDERQKAEINLTKACEIPENAPEDFNPYQDVQFALYAKEDVKTVDGTIVIPAGSMLEVVSFDKDGNTVFRTDLPFGSFYVQEYMYGAGYVYDDTKYDVIFEYAGQDVAVVNINVNEGNAIENKLQRGGFKLIKTFEGKDYPLEGIPFHIVGKTTVGTTVEYDVKTDKNGEVILEGLLVGSYTISELECELSVGYNLSPDEVFAIAPDRITELTINNTLMRGDLKIIKEFESKVTPLAGIPFTITGKTLVGTDYEETLETDENGQIILQGLLVGEYKIKELACDLSVGYVLSEEQTVVVANEKVEQMKIENKLIRGNIRLVKTDSKSGQTLAGAVFDLYDPAGVLQGSYTTNDKGEICIEGLVYGFGYKLVETKAPAGYKLDQTEIGFDITENGKTIELTATNTFVPPDIPKTGDDSLPIWVWISLIVASGAAALGAILLKRRKRTK